MKKLLFSLKSKHKQQGIALIFALAMLSLLLIMAVGFATSAIFEQKAAYNSANATSARLLCQTATSRVLSLLQSQISLYGQTLDYSCDRWTVNKDHMDMLDHLNTYIGNTPIYVWNKTRDVSWQHNVSWEYMKTNDGVTDRLVGRSAYVMIPIGGIDPAAVVKSGVNEASALASERRVGVSVDEINIQSVSPSDIVVTPSSSQVAAVKFNYPATAGGLLPGTAPNGAWASYTNMFTKMGITSGPLKSKFLKWFIIDPPPPINEYYWVDRDGDGFPDHVPTTNNEKYYRFNLSRTAANWNLITNLSLTDKKMYSAILLDSNGDGVPDTPPTPLPLSPGADPGNGIPWLAFFGYDKNGAIDDTQKGTFASVVDRRRQIAANLVQYCRATTTPLTDVLVANWLLVPPNIANDPTYTGNRRSPYLNEMGAVVTAGVTRAGATVTVTLNGNLFVELINIYPDWTNVACATTTIFSYSFKVYVGGTLKSNVTVPYRTFAYTVPAGATNWAKGYSSLPAAQPFFRNTANSANAAWSTAYTISPATADAAVSVTDFKLDIDKVVYNSFDCAKIKSASSASTATSTWTLLNNVLTTNSGFSPVNSQMHVSFQTNDPRQNLNPGDWCVKETAAAGMNGAQKIAPVISDSTLVWTKAAKNKFNGVDVDPAAAGIGKDQETVHDPAYNSTTGAALSTAYIRHGIMLSPWELGFIHRGAAWETINLKEYDLNKGYKFVNTGSGIIPGGGAYSDPVNGGGDANILNQIKMVPSTSAVNAVANKTVNLNSIYVDSFTGKNITLQAMLANIRIGNNPKNLGVLAGDSEGSKITAPSDAIDNLGLAIMAKRNGMDFFTRAEVANAKTSATATTNALSDGTCGIPQDTDAKQEELIGKFINITDVGGKNNYFYVIVLAQTIKDVGGPSSGSGINITKSKMNGSNRITSSITCKLGAFDYDATNNLYFDEITSEQKIRLLVFADPSDSYKCKVLSYEFIE